MAELIGFDKPVFCFQDDRDEVLLEISAYFKPNETDLNSLRKMMQKHATQEFGCEFIDVLYLHLCMVPLYKLAKGAVSAEAQGYLKALSDAGISVILTGAKFRLF